MYSEDELAVERGIANEERFSDFVQSIGGRRVSDLVSNPDFDNADFVFETQRVVVELKILESEFSHTEQFETKVEKLTHQVVAARGQSPLLHPLAFSDFVSGLVELYRPPLGRIVKKANRQIRSTKEFLKLPEYEGLLFIVNDGFTSLPPDRVTALLARILRGSCSSIQGFVYLTNHLVSIPGDDFARYVWIPSYSEAATESLVEFVDWLGKTWFNFCAQNGQASDDPTTTSDRDFLVRTRVLGQRNFPRLP